MIMRVEVTVKLDIDMGRNDDLEEVLCNMDYGFSSMTENVNIIDTEILDWSYSSRFHDSRV